MNSLILFFSILPQILALNFLAVGDWGGDENSPYYTSGQLASVVGMDKIAQQLNSQFVIAVGDNMYHDGVTNEYDPRFQESFEDVYTPASLQTPWYPVIGNHDSYGNISAQIAYTSLSKRWEFPSEYYSKSFTSEDGATIDIIFINTVDLASINLKKVGEEGYFDPLPEMPRSKASTQWDWIEAQMKASTADYLLVVGHYPVYSVCEHGNTQTLISHLRPLLIQYNAHYLMGHDHCMEHLIETDSAVNYFLTGMGVECCYAAINKKRVPEGSLQWYIAKGTDKASIIAGFSSFQVSKDGMVVIYYDQAGNILYTAPKVAPRK